MKPDNNSDDIYKLAIGSIIQERFKEEFGWAFRNNH